MATVSQAEAGEDDYERLTAAQWLHHAHAVNVAAPMVRYSKLPFRELVSGYNTHLTHTPMIIANEFASSAIARDAEFSTSTTERGHFVMQQHSPHSISDWDPLEPRPDHTRHDHFGRTLGPRRLVRGALVAQFAANEPETLAQAASLISPWVDGIDLNCGCPQKWAFQDGIGCALLRQPAKVADLLAAVRRRVPSSVSLSLKIRLDADTAQTRVLIDNALALSHGAVDYLTIHGRTRHQASSGHPVNLEGIRWCVDECVRSRVPCIANGDVWDYVGAVECRERTNCRGVMSARGLLANPALFDGHSYTPRAAIDHFVRLSAQRGLIYPLFHRHVSYMLETRCSKRDRTWLNSLSSKAAVVDFLRTLDEALGHDPSSSCKK